MGSATIVLIMLLVLIFIIFPVLSVFVNSNSEESNKISEIDAVVEDASLIKNTSEIYHLSFFDVLFSVYSKTILLFAFVMIFVNPFLAFYYLFFAFIVGFFPLITYYFLCLIIFKLNFANYFTLTALSIFVCSCFSFLIDGMGYLGKILFPILVVHALVISIFTHKIYSNEN
jgi:hypothetical protein